MLKPIGIIGAGGWGIALAKLLADKGEQVTLWCHGAESYRELQENRESRTYLAGILLPSSIKFTRSIEAAVTDKSLIICAVPSHTVRGVMASTSTYVSSQTNVLCGTKGLEEESLKTMGRSWLRSSVTRSNKDMPFCPVRHSLLKSLAACRPPLR